MRTNQCRGEGACLFLIMQTFLNILCLSHDQFTAVHQLLYFLVLLPTDVCWLLGHFQGKPLQDTQLLCLRKENVWSSMHLWRRDHTMSHFLVLTVYSMLRLKLEHGPVLIICVKCVCEKICVWLPGCVSPLLSFLRPHLTIQSSQPFRYRDSGFRIRRFEVGDVWSLK